MTTSIRSRPVGRDGIMFDVPDMVRPSVLATAVGALRLPGVWELVPGATTVLVRFDPTVVSPASVIEAVAHADLSHAGDGSAAAQHTIDVVYRGADLADVADILGVSGDTVVAMHTARPYRVAFTGFAPGFAYLEGGHEALDVPRRSSPRTRIPAGAVALAGRFSGIYPRDSPGGWQLIGETAAQLWDEGRERAALLQPGDSVSFRSARELVTLPPASERTAVRGSSAVLRVLMPGLRSLIQDAGRAGHAASGVARSGAADRDSLIAANALVGNEPHAAAIEVVAGSFSAEALAPVVIAVAGPKVPVQVVRANGVVHRVAESQALLLDAGDVIRLGAIVDGARCYVSVRGGIAAQTSLGSASTDTLAGLGPAPLEGGAEIRVGQDPTLATGHARSWRERRVDADGAVLLPVWLGPRDDWFTPAGIRTFLDSTWVVSVDADRVGVRLVGGTRAEGDAERTIERADTGELGSEGCVPGAIQVPASGRPLIFLADHPVTGGYPVIAVVDAGSLAAVGQLRPGDSVRFVSDSHDDEYEGAAS